MTKTCIALGLSLLIAISLSAYSHPHGSSASNQQKVVNQQAQETELLETGRPSKLPSQVPGTEIKVVSFNVRWPDDKDAGKLALLFKHDKEIGGATILALQEVDRNKKRTGNKNIVKTLAEELGMHYAWAAPPKPKSEKEEETGVAILSPYALTDVTRIVLPHDGPGGRRRVALGATVKSGAASLRIYSVHSETRISISKKLDQMKAVLEDLKHYDKEMPALVVGDLNTWEQEAVSRTEKLFTSEGFHTPFDTNPTFSRRVLFISIDLKLDWIWLRNLEATSHGVDRDVELSDHWPLWAVVRPKKT